MLQQSLIIITVLSATLGPASVNAQLTYQAEQISRLTRPSVSSMKSVSAFEGRGESLRGASPGFHASDADRPVRRTTVWHLDLAMRVGYTKLGSTKQQLDRRLDLPLRLDVLDFFDSPHTPMDGKSELTQSTLYAGIGREHNDWLAWTIYFGGGYAKDHTHQRTLNANLTTEFKYLALYTGMTFELYPWGTPDYQRNTNWEERLRSSRPYLLTGGEVGYISAEGRGDYSIAPFRIYEDSVEIRDWLFSVLLGMGWGIPISDNWSFNLAFDYAFHLYRPEEYNTWNMITAFRYRF